MRRIAVPTALLLTVLAVACSDTTRPGPEPARTLTGPRANQSPTISLDQQITSLIQALFPTGLQTAAGTRWESIKDKYAAGLTDASQMTAAKQKLTELVTWVQQKTPQMDPPPNGLTRQAAAAQLVLYMSLYVYNGPLTAPPIFPTGADATVGVVTPTAPVTVVTPTLHAGVAVDAGSVNQNTIVIVRQNAAYYPANCTGPMSTSLCQYPQFYVFDEFPHVRLNKPAHFSVCHVNSGTTRAPLWDYRYPDAHIHDRFRLAHTLPANPDDYTPGATQEEGIEILPLISQTFANCNTGDNYSPPPTGSLWERGRRALEGFAALASRVIAPRAALAIDQGGGGDALSFSDFNDVDPQGQPDNKISAYNAPAQGASGSPLTSVSFTITNIGTAASLPTTATIQLVPQNGSAITLSSVPVPALVPLQSASFAPASLVIPGATAPGNYTLSLAVAPNAGIPEIDLTNNSGAAPITITTAAGGFDLVVFNDVNIFDDHGMADTNNQQLVRNLVSFSNGGVRGSGTGVLWYQGHGSLKTIDASNSFPYQFQTLQSTVSNAGYTFTYGTPDLTSLDPSYKAVFIDLPTSQFSSGELGALQVFALNGGRVIYIGENDYAYASYVPVENAFLSGMGVSIVDLGGAIDCGYNHLPASALRPTEVTTGLTDLTMACSAAVSAGSADTPFMYSIDGTHILGALTTITRPMLYAQAHGSVSAMRAKARTGVSLDVQVPSGVDPLTGTAPSTSQSRHH